MEDVSFRKRQLEESLKSVSTASTATPRTILVLCGTYRLDLLCI